MILDFNFVRLFSYLHIDFMDSVGSFWSTGLPIHNIAKMAEYVSEISHLKCVFLYTEIK